MGGQITLEGSSVGMRVATVDIVAAGRLLDTMSGEAVELKSWQTLHDGAWTLDNVLSTPDATTSS